MKTIIALALSFVLLSQAAVAETHDELRLAYEDMVITLEIDGPGVEPYATEVFQKSLADLQERGLSNEELVTFLIGKIKDKAHAEQVAEAYKLIETDKLCMEQLKELLATVRAESSKKGASWSGSATVVTASIVTIVVTGAVLVYLKTKHDTAKNSVGNIR